MKQIIHAFALFGLGAGSIGFGQPDAINLGGRKDRVITIEVRENVLNAARVYLSRGEDEFIAEIAHIRNPYIFDQPSVAEAPAPVEKPQAAVPVNYDDASVLAVIAADFSTQVRGRLSRGSRYFLQLAGGALLRPGSTFPARIPQIQGETFDVTVTEITERGFTLQLGEASLYTPFISKSTHSPGATRDTEK